MTAIPYEQYFTKNKQYVAELVKDIVIDEGSIILEPCAGQKHIINALKDYDIRAQFYTNDIDPSMPTQLHHDATQQSFWEQFVRAVEQPEWVITNPPFSLAPIIVEYSLRYATSGVAMLLPINFLEGCQDRTFLVKYPPTMLTVLPRYSFTEDGHMDSKTVSWFIWEIGLSSSIRIVSKFPYNPKVLKVGEYSEISK